MRSPFKPTQLIHLPLASSRIRAGAGALSLLLIACLVAVSSPPVVSNAQNARQVRTGSRVKTPNGDSWTGREPDQSPESWTNALATSTGLRQAAESDQKEGWTSRALNQAPGFWTSARGKVIEWPTSLTPKRLR